ncbi:hypothetical protein LEMLEM_LOCUS5028 [Lemmus lemmus]
MGKIHPRKFWTDWSTNPYSYCLKQLQVGPKLRVRIMSLSAAGGRWGGGQVGAELGQIAVRAPGASQCPSPWPPDWSEKPSLLLTIHNALSPHVSPTNVSNVSHGESFIRIDWLSSVQTFAEY